LIWTLRLDGSTDDDGGERDAAEEDEATHGLGLLAGLEKVGGA
jgi:hypothetical protein